MADSLRIQILDVGLGYNVEFPPANQPSYFLSTAGFGCNFGATLISDQKRRFVSEQLQQWKLKVSSSSGAIGIGLVDTDTDRWRERDLLWFGYDPATVGNTRTPYQISEGPSVIFGNPEQNLVGKWVTMTLDSANDTFTLRIDVEGLPEPLICSKRYNTPPRIGVSCLDTAQIFFPHPDTTDWFPAPPPSPRQPGEGGRAVRDSGQRMHGRRVV
eukprot:CAMPEP_0177740668 /NCGR_PEP_ID=MMETSP0484_2-20121128/27691_1 /TAXON_ID=354590 /ORGANISM="Rhodomonas lens, Strain RHODO" /LENGTH=213 /DNA_ID=CAMNT_0019254831 /DNA_START=15 /DNA_END=653 /DNA_ORIENTATION=+